MLTFFSSNFSSWLTAPTDKITRPRTLFWLSLSLIYAALFGIMALIVAYRYDYSIQDDARIHITWLLKFIDPDLFPNDFLANYYISNEPYGYLTLYRLFALLGIDAITVGKIIPPILGLLTTAYGFLLAFEMLPVPLVGFFSSVFLNQLLWNYDTLITATPRAFGPLFFLATLYYFLRNSRWLFLGMIALLGGFYQILLLPLAGILFLQLFLWKKGIPRRFTLDKSKLLLCLSGLALIIIIVLYYALIPSQYDPIVTKVQALAMREFQKGGRVEFFFKNLSFYFLESPRSGLQLQRVFEPQILYLGLLLPILICYSSYFPLIKFLHRKTTIILQLIIVSLGLFVLAHLTLFKLYLPNRYGSGLQYASRFATALVLVILLDALLRQLSSLSNQRLKNYTSRFWQRLFLLFFGVTLAFIIIISPSHFLKLTHNYVKGNNLRLYQFFEQQPKDIMIASLAIEASAIPSFTRRSVLVAREFAHPYELGYYNVFRQRTLDLIKAQYSSNSVEVKDFIKKYGVDYFLLEKSAFQSDYFTQSFRKKKYAGDWLTPFKAQLQSIEKKLEKGMNPVLLTAQEKCTVFENDVSFVIESNCILKTSFDNLEK